MSTEATIPVAAEAPAGDQMTFNSALDGLYSTSDAQPSQEGETKQEPPALPATPGLDAAPAKAEVPEVKLAESKPAEGEAKPAAAEEKPGEEEPEDDIDDEPKPVKEDEKHHWYTKSKADRMIEAWRYKREIEQAIPGASLDTLKEMYQYNVGAKNLLTDLHSGDPDAVQGATEFLLDPQRNPGANVLAATVAERALAFPDVQQRVEQKAVGGLLDRLYQTAAQSNDENVLKLAQHLDYHLNKAYRTAEEIAKPSQNGEEANPWRSRAMELERREQQRQVQEAKGRVSQLDQTIESEVDSVIEEALAAVKHLKDAPEWEVMTTHIRNKINKAASANTAFAAEVREGKKQFSRAGSAELRDAVVNKVRALANQVARSERKALIDRYGKAKVADNAATHQQMQQNAQKVEPGGATAAPRTTDPREQLRQAKTFDEALSAMGYAPDA